MQPGYKIGSNRAVFFYKMCNIIIYSAFLAIGDMSDICGK